MATILVTGSNGQLGSEIKALTNNTEDTYIFTDVAELDITNKEAIKEKCKNESVDFIINCAAYTAVDKAEEDTDNAYKINADAPKYLAEVSAEIGAKFIHVSTDYVFDGTSCTPYKEDDAVNPNSVYGESKLKGEQNITEADPSAIIIRTSWLYSSFGNNFVKTMIKLGTDRDSLGVIFDQVGTPTYARDLAIAIIEIITQTKENTTKFIPGIYHFSNEGVCSWYDFAIEIHKLAGVSCNVKPIETADYPTPARRPSYSVLNKSKIKQNFSIDIPHWVDSLKDCVYLLGNN